LCLRAPSSRVHRVTAHVPHGREPAIQGRAHHITRHDGASIPPPAGASRSSLSRHVHRQCLLKMRGCAAAFALKPYTRDIDRGARPTIGSTAMFIEGAASHGFVLRARLRAISVAPLSRRPPQRGHAPRPPLRFVASRRASPGRLARRASEARPHGPAPALGGPPMPVSRLGVGPRTRAVEWPRRLRVGAASAAMLSRLDAVRTRPGEAD
jgi:hypothetical protein